MGAGEDRLGKVREARLPGRAEKVAGGTRWLKKEDSRRPRTNSIHASPCKKGFVPLEQIRIQEFGGRDQAVSKSARVRPNLRY